MAKQVFAMCLQPFYYVLAIMNEKNTSFVTQDATLGWVRTSEQVQLEHLKAHKSVIG